MIKNLIIGSVIVTRCRAEFNLKGKHIHFNKERGKIMYEEFAHELAYYEYMRSESQRLGKPKSADYWDAKYQGLARGIEIATGSYPCATRHGETVDIRIGEYQAVKFFS